MQVQRVVWLQVSHWISHLHAHLMYRKRGGLHLSHQPRQEKDQSSTYLELCLMFAYLLDLLTARAVDRATHHDNFSLLPINLGVMSLQPGKSKNQVLLIQTGYYEQGLLQVDLILEYYVYYFRYLSHFIWDAIDIVHRYRLREPMSIETMLLHKTWTNKNSNSSRVDQSMH